MALDLKIIKDPDTQERRLSLKNGNLETTNGPAECAQRIETALKTVLGELVWDESKGLPLFDQIFKRQQYDTLILNYYRQALLAVNNVRAVQELRLERGRERDYTLYFTVFYDSGEVINGKII